MYRLHQGSTDSLSDNTLTIISYLSKVGLGLRCARLISDGLLGVPTPTMDLSLTVQMRRKFTLTPVSGCASPRALCAGVVDRKLNDYIELGVDEWSLPIFGCLSPATTINPSTRVSVTPSASPTTTAPLSLPPKNRTAEKQKRLYSHRQEVRNSIASRLPARSQATFRRRFHTAVARNLLPRTANRATYNRNRTRANQNRCTELFTKKPKRGACGIMAVLAYEERSSGAD